MGTGYIAHLDRVELSPGDQDRVVLVVFPLSISSQDGTKVVIRDELLVLWSPAL